MSGDPDTHPLNFENLSFNAISHYLQTMRKSLKRAKPSSDDANIMVTETITLRLTASSFDGVCSSLANLFTECEVPKDVSAATKDMWLRLSTYKKGSRRASARERREVGLCTAEGKGPLPVKCLQYLAEVLHRSKEPEHIAALFFLLLEWNLLSRADMVINAHIDLFGISNDALLCFVGPSKTDQEGVKHADHPFHMYSCPENPAICVVTAFARFMIAHPEVLKGDMKIFYAVLQYGFNNIFNDVVCSPQHRQFFLNNGITPEYFGTHSLRKGAVTFVACGVTSSPPICSICIRANWKLPGVMN